MNKRKKPAAGVGPLTVTKLRQNSRGPAHVPPSVMHTLLLLALSSLLSSCLGDLQGLYTTLPGDGQLQLVNWTSGLSSPVGAGLAAAGLAVPACAPGLIQQTADCTWAVPVSEINVEMRLRLGPPLGSGITPGYHDVLCSCPDS